MKKKSVLKYLGVGIILMFMFALVSSEVWARAGGGRSGGSRGSRTFSAPRTQSPGPSQFQRSTPAPSPSPGLMGNQARPSTGSPFLRGLAGGIAGGFLGSMLFSGLSHGGTGGGWGGGGIGGSGLGFLEIILIGVLIFIVFRFIRKKTRSRWPISRGLLCLSTLSAAGNLLSQYPKSGSGCGHRDFLYSIHGSDL